MAVSKDSSTNNLGIEKSTLIEVLRGISILLVVLFHLGIKQFHNGWIGVDLFFIISGFLMQKIYVKKILDGNSLYFYRKRIQRLLPAFIVVQLLVLFFFYFRTLPLERLHIFRETLASNLMASNLYYWAGDQYFSNASLRPILNFWSLALELQFYLLFPIIAIICKRSLPRLAAITSISLIVFYLLLSISERTSFFFLISRIWEFGLGMIAYELSKRLQIRKFTNLKRASLLPILVIALLSFSSLKLTLNQTFAFQVLLCLLMSCVLTIQYNYRGVLNIFLNKFSLLGKFSYSIYLIHLPIIVYLNYIPFHGNINRMPSGVKLLYFFGLVTLGTFLLHKFIENPFRFKFKFSRISMLFASSLTLVLVLNVFYPLFYTKGYSKDEVTIALSKADRGPFRCGLISGIEILNSPSEICLLTLNQPLGKDYLLVGNSSADAIKETVANAVKASGNNLWLIKENNPLNPTTLKAYLESVKKHDIQKVILHTRSGSNDLIAVDQFVRELSILKIPLVIIYPTPDAEFDVPSFLWNQIHANSNSYASSFMNLTELEYLKINKLELSYYERLSRDENVTVVPVVDLFCKPKCQIKSVNGWAPWYFDSNHLTRSGASILYTRLKQILI